MKVGILGGTFDPIHLGHLILAESARDRLLLERVIFVPAGHPWRKAGRAIAPAVHRLAMLELAVADNPLFFTSTIEVDQEGPAYTVDTLSRLRSEMDLADELFFIIGADSLADFPNWREPQRIIALASLAVGQRPGSPQILEADLERAVPGLARRVSRFTMPAIDVSSTDTRQRCRDGRSIRYLVPLAVEAYIHRHHLYDSALT